ncbi:toprim domain-containing protein [Candidatus Bandiella numerosa]|uniref:toprim domain-containing protein n=1 Tax=Candidatus Bandiella numerosa TaxID=2570586 RepID=UPI001F1CED39|nr:toprim domain-containing protein [Candidatus Bandiella numerosa]
MGYKEEFTYQVKEKQGKENKSTNKVNAEEIEQQKKLKAVKKISRSAVPVNNGTKIVNNYLTKHRGINLGQINLSKDIRSTTRAWSSETKKYTTALVAIARDKDGKESGAQIIYLDSKTHNKDKSLEVNKRTMGGLKGSFVELTSNAKSGKLYIAEGVETGLSIAAADKEARVIVGLGISNMLNIGSYLKSCDKNKDVTIVADNDGKESQTAKLVDKSARKLAQEGFENVMVMKPKVKGYDFNDVLKIRGEKGVKAYMESPIKNKLEISAIKTRDLGIEELKEGLEEVAKQNLRVADNKKDYVSIQTIIEKMVVKIINHRNIYGKEASGTQKKEFFNESRYELKREKYWKNHVESKNPAKEASDLLKQQEITERLVNIDTRLANRASENYQPMPADQVLREYKENTAKMHDLTRDLGKKGYGTQGTEFIAREMVKYQEKHGFNMPTQQISKLCSISNYVQKQYDLLAKSGFNRDEARIAFSEGSRMLSKYDRGNQDFVVNKEGVKSIQQHSKRELEINASKQQNSKSNQIENTGFEM